MDATGQHTELNLKYGEITLQKKHKKNPCQMSTYIVIIMLKAFIITKWVISTNKNKLKKNASYKKTVLYT